METQLREKEKDNLELRKELRHKENLVAALRSNLRNKERKFLEELKRRSHRVTILNTELQKQTEAAAYLSFQLHATKQKLHSSRQSSKPLTDRPAEKAFLPLPCGEAKPKKRTQKSHSRRQAASSFHSKAAFKDMSSRDRLSSFEEVEPMPDPALFLYTKRPHAPSHRHKSEAKFSALSTKVGTGHRDPASPKGGPQRSSRQPSQELTEATSSIRTLGKSRPLSKADQSQRNGSSPPTSRDIE